MSKSSAARRFVPGVLLSLSLVLIEIAPRYLSRDEDERYQISQLVGSFGSCFCVSAGSGFREFGSGLSWSDVGRKLNRIIDAMAPRVLLSIALRDVSMEQERGMKQYWSIARSGRISFLRFAVGRPK